jgi:hypothetical protein
MKTPKLFRNLVVYGVVVALAIGAYIVLTFL